MLNHLEGEVATKMFKSTTGDRRQEAGGRRQETGSDTPFIIMIIND